MSRLSTGVLAAFVGVLCGCQNSPVENELTAPPLAEIRPTERVYHGRILKDDYFWLKDASYPVVDDEDVLAYLQQENLWYAQQMAPRQALVDELFGEMKGRIEEDLSAVPWQEGDYIYRWRYLPGSEYRLWERKPKSGGEFTTILDESLESKGLEFFSMGSFSVSPDGRMLAWSADFDGSEEHRLIVDDLVSGTRHDDGLHRVAAGDMAWGAQSKTLLYVPLEEDGWFRQRVKSHRVGTAPDRDVEVFYNPDRGLSLSLSESQSREYALIRLDDRTQSEVRYLRTSDLGGELAVFAAMREGHRYEVDHGHDRFYIISNDEHINYRIATAPEADPSEENWATLLQASDQSYYRDLVILRDFIAVEEMSDGLQRIRIRTLEGGEHHVDFPEKVYSASLGNNPSIDASFLRINYESMITPNSVYDYSIDRQQLALRQQRKIPSGYDKAEYMTTRLWAPARDGVPVPVSLVHRKSTPVDGAAPVLLYGYGAYGYGTEPYFSSARLSLLDRGVIFAIAHVRGGDEMGYQWYLDGKLEKRANTFNDFVDVAAYLVDQGFVRKGNIAIRGGSAGGELVGAAVIQVPAMWAAAVLDVPFVDVLNTGLDASLPLTPLEWPEWGNPIESAAAFDLIQSYSPYDNINARDYPPMLVTGGLNDPRVTYWEPAKWTAKMRALKTDDKELIMRINMGAGHQGKSGRYAILREEAESYAFVLEYLGKLIPQD